MSRNMFNPFSIGTPQQRAEYGQGQGRQSGGQQGGFSHTHAQSQAGFNGMQTFQGSYGGGGYTSQGFPDPSRGYPCAAANSPNSGYDYSSNNGFGSPYNMPTYQQGAWPQGAATGASSYIQGSMPIDLNPFAGGGSGAGGSGSPAMGMGMGGMSMGGGQFGQSEFLPE